MLADAFEVIAPVAKHLAPGSKAAELADGLASDYAFYQRLEPETALAGKDIRIVDLTDQVGKIDIQGPAAIKTMAKLLKNPEVVFDKRPYFSAKGHFDPAPALRLLLLVLPFAVSAVLTHIQQRERPR